MTRRCCPIAAAILLSAACSREEKKEIEAPAPVQVTAVTQDTIRRVVKGDDGAVRYRLAIASLQTLTGVF